MYKIRLTSLKNQTFVIIEIEFEELILMKLVFHLFNDQVRAVFIVDF